MGVWMSASQYQRDLDRKRKQRIDAERKAGDQRSKESKYRADAAKARQAGAKTKGESMARSKQREAERLEANAAAAGREATRWQGKASGYAREEAALTAKLVPAQQTEADAAERKRKREEQRAALATAADISAMDSRIRRVESAVNHAGGLQPRPPRPEKLRVLILGASPEGDLRIGREQKRIRAAVESALHRDLIEFDVRPAATTSDLLDGISKFRPHVIHFSGHSDEKLILFEEDRDERHEGVIVTAGAFARAIQATGNPPLLVVLNACKSAAQIDDLAAQVVPFAIGMSDSIDDGDAIAYAARFYASVANGESIRSAHLLGKSALELVGLEGGATDPCLVCHR
jgi:CHAT domain-containing protein